MTAKLRHNNRTTPQTAEESKRLMNSKKHIKGAKGEIDQSLIEGTGNGGLFSAGYFHDGPLAHRLRDTEQVDYALQNLTHGIAVEVDGTEEDISPDSDYRTALLVTDGRLLYVVGQSDGDETFSIPYTKIEDTEASSGILKDRITINTGSKSYHMFVQKGSNPEEITDHINTLSKSDTQHVDNPTNHMAEEPKEDVTPEREDRNAMSDGTNNSSRTETGSVQDDNNSRKNGTRDSSKSHTRINDKKDSSPSDVDIRDTETGSATDSEASVEVLVSAEDDEPITGATVSLSGTAFSTKGRTSQTGRCSLTSPANAETVLVEVNHPDHGAVREEVTTLDDAVIDIVLAQPGDAGKESDEISNNGESSSCDNSKSRIESSTREKLLEELVTLNDAHSQKVTRGRMRSEGAYTPEDYEDEFGSWSAALEAMSFPNQEDNEGTQTQTQQQDPYSKEEILDAIADVIETSDRSPTIKDMHEHGKISPSPAYRYFDSWSDAVDAARRHSSEQQTVSPRDKYSRRDVIEELGNVSEISGGRPSKEDFKKHGKIDERHVYDLFDNWTHAVTVAMREYSSFSQPSQQSPEYEKQLTSGSQQHSDSPQDKYSRIDVIEELGNVSEIIGGRPSKEHFKKHGKIDERHVYDLFDNWTHAVTVAMREHSKSSQSSESEKQIASEDQQHSGPEKGAEDDDCVTKREYSDGTQSSDTTFEEDGSETRTTNSTPSEESVDPDEDSNVSSGEFADLTSFQRDLLLVVNGLKDPKGLEIKEELGKYYEDEIHHGRLYPNLDTLVEEDLVKKTARDKRSNQYELTVHGSVHLEERQRWQQQRIEQHRVQKSGSNTKSDSTSKIESSERDVTTEPTALQEKTSNDNSDRMPESADPDEKPKHTPEQKDTASKNDPLAGDITEVPEGRLSGIVVKIVQKRNMDGEKRDAVFDIETAGGKRIDLTIWSKHGVKIDFGAGDVIQLDEVRLKRWERDYGYAHRLSSTKDLTITHIHEDSESWGLESEYSENEDLESEDSKVDTSPKTQSFVGIGGATESDAEALVEAGYTSIDELRDESLEELRSISGLDDGTALRIKAELG